MATINLTSDHTSTIILNAGDVLNVPGGVTVTAAADAVDGRGGNTVNNAGTINSTGAEGVNLGDAGLSGSIRGNDLVTNTGTINASSTAVDLKSDNGIVVNSGMIYSANQSGVYITATNFAAVSNSGTISGSTYGIDLDAVNGAVENKAGGQIVASNGEAVYMDLTGGAYLNNAGTINGYTTGVYISADGRVDVLNSGSITGSNDYGVYVSTSGPVLFQNLTASSSVTGADYGVYISSDADVVVTNAGSIAGTNDYGVYVETSGNIDVENAGSISGEYGVYLTTDANALVNNSGTITATNDYGVYVSTYGNTEINNTGTILATNDTGVYISASGSAVVHNLGTITGTQGVYIDDAENVQVINSGSITGTSGDGVEISATGNVLFQNLTATSSVSATETGVYISSDADVVVTNAGSITAGSSYYGVEVETSGNVDVENAGKISGDYGVYVSTDANVLVNNSGMITAGNQTGVYVSTDGNVKVNNTGTISSTGDTAVQITSTANVTVNNFGTIQAFSSSYDGINIDTDGFATVNNAAGASILAGDTAIYISASAGAMVNNAGTVTANNGYALYDVGGLLNLHNTGTMSALNDTAVYISGDHNQVWNTGTIKGLAGDGVYISGDANNVLNTGSIIAVDAGSGVGLYLDGDGNQVVNAGPAANIYGDEYGIELASSGSSIIQTVVNSGNIDGGVTGIWGSSGRDYITNTGLIGGGTDAFDLRGGNDVFDNSFGVIVGKGLMGSGNDTFFGGHTAFNVDGGADTGVNTPSPALTVAGELATGLGGGDTLSFQKVAGAFTIDLTAGTATDGTVTDTITGFENVVGSTGNDKIKGDLLINVLDGGPGGADTIDGGGAPTSSVSLVRTAVVGDPGVVGEPTADIVTGDIVSYATSKTGVYIDLTSQLTWDGVANDTLIGIESAIGSNFNDTIWGNNDSNTLRGGAGDDVMHGLGGADAFYYKELNFGHDTISDFSVAEHDVLAFDATLFQPASLTYLQVDANDVLVSWDAADTILVHSTTAITVADVTAQTVFV